MRAVVTAMAEAGADTVVLADTIGTGHPEQARALAELALEIVPAERLGMHIAPTVARASTTAPSVCSSARDGLVRRGCGTAPSRRAPPATSATLISSRCSTTPAWRTASTARGSSTRTPPSRRRSAER